ncbi:PTS system mannose/fructose/sorbose family transporter subunit IID [Romboutsia weinsteinii]|nr:PTS system mannose/fructose/sorbose family transporter subunit IID [Romboutsia weinsteinii]
MASNTETMMRGQKEYIDKTEGETLDNKTLNKMAWRSMFLQASFNYERMQAGGWLYSILPGLKKIHKNKEDLSTSMKHNLEFFNCHPFLITFVMGIILSLEQKKSDVQTIRALRVAAMGPLGGIGDAIFWFTLLPISAGIGANLSLQGSILGPIIFFVLFNVVHLGLRFGLMHWSYKVGVEGISKLTKNAKEFTRAATVLGMIVAGALIASYVSITLVTPESLSMSGTIDLQKILDSIMPCVLPLAVTFGMYGLVKKNVSPLVNILVLVLIGLIGAFIGVFKF